MRGHQPSDPNLDGVDAAGEQKLDQQETVGHQLGGDGYKVEVGTLASLVLSDGVARGDYQGRQIRTGAGDDLVENLVYRISNMAANGSGSLEVDMDTNHRIQDSHVVM
jgi:hypothetical protein